MLLLSTQRTVPCALPCALPETFTDVGTNIIEKTWYAPAGYTYRTYTTVVVKNSRTGKVVETATADSPFIYR